MLVPSIFSDNFVDDFFGDMFAVPQVSRKAFTPKPALMSTDVKEYDDKYELAVELPGFAKEDIKAELKDGYLTITAKHDEENEEKDKHGKFIRKERYTGQCRRSFFVGEHLTEEDIKGSFEGGVLKIGVPKKEQIPEKEESKYIMIE